MKSSSIYAILAAFILLNSVATMMLEPANAQGAVSFELQNDILLEFTDGKVYALTDYRELYPQDVLYNSKTIRNVIFRSYVNADPDVPIVVSYTNSIVWSLKVRNAQGNYVDIPQTQADKSLRKLTFPESCTTDCIYVFDDQWRIFYLKVPIQTIDNLIGQRASDYDSEIRFGVGPTTGVKISAKVGTGVTRDYSAPSYTIVAPIKARTNHFIEPQPPTQTPPPPPPPPPSQNPPPSQTPTIQPPTGKVWSRVIINYENPDGSASGSETFLSNQLAAFDVSAVGSGQNIKSVKYQVLGWLDKDLYIPVTTLRYTDQSSTNNFVASVDNKGVDKDYKTTITKMAAPSTGGAQYLLLEMEVTGAALENALTNDLGTVGKTQFKSGQLKFFNKASTWVVKDSTGQEYNINIPADNVVINLTSAKTIEQSPPGEIECKGTTECDVIPDEPIRAGPGIDTTWLLAGIGIIVVGVIGGTILITKRKH